MKVMSFKTKDRQMKISEFVKKLNEIQRNEGDIEVMDPDESILDCITVEDVTNPDFNDEDTDNDEPETKRAVIICG